MKISLGKTFISSINKLNSTKKSYVFSKKILIGKGIDQKTVFYRVWRKKVLPLARHLFCTKTKFGEQIAIISAYFLYFTMHVKKILNFSPLSSSFYIY